MASAINQRLEPKTWFAAADVQGADSFRTVQLVSRKTEQIDRCIAHVEGDSADGLRRVGMEEHSSFATNLRNLGNWVNRAHLVVRVDHGDKNRSSSNRNGHVFGADHPEGIYWQNRDLNPLALKGFCGIQH